MLKHETCWKEFLLAQATAQRVNPSDFTLNSSADAELLGNCRL